MSLTMRSSLICRWKTGNHSSNLGGMADVRLKRIYEPATNEDGRRYLVERLWPRGVSKEKAHLTAWLKDAAPSPELRTWYGHDPDRWEEFRLRYIAELKKKPAVIATLREESRKGPVTLVFATKTQELSCAQALKEYLETESRG